MHDLNSITDLREHLNSLSGMYIDLNQLLEQLKAVMDHQTFIPESLYESLHEKMTLIISSQKDFIGKYSDLEIGILPEDIPSMNQKLEEQYKFLTEKKSFADIIQFVMSLHSEQTDIENDLTKEKESLKKFDIFSNSVETCKEYLKKYVLLKQVFEEQDPRTKFMLIMSNLSSQFSLPITYGLNTNAIVYHEDSEENKINPWIDLGISDKDSVIYHVDDKYLHVQIAPRQKKFSASSLKNELLSRSYGAEKMFLLTNAYDLNGITAEAVACLADDNLESFQTAADKLVQSGYFKKYILDKNNYEQYEPYYVLTPNGVKIFTSKEASAILNRKPVKIETKGEKIPDTANSLLVRILASKSHQLMNTICKSGAYIEKMFDLNTEACIKFYPVLDGPNYAFVIMISDTLASFAEFRKTLLAHSDNMDIVIVMGMNKAHAKALGLWVNSIVNTEDEQKQIVYFDVEEQKYYSLEDDGEVELFEESINAELDTDEMDNLINMDEMDNTDEIVDVADIAHTTEPETPVKPVIQKQENLVTSSEFERFTAVYQQMLSSDHFYCASAYVHALSAKYQDFIPVYQQLAYALNDPMANCNYNSEQLFTVYFSEDKQLSEYYVVSAVIRNYFLDHCSYDHSIQMLQGAISGFELLSNNISLNQAIYSLQKFKAVHHHGIDFYADYRQKNREAFEEDIKKIRYEAKEYYENYCCGKESGFHRRMIETNKIIYSNGTEIATFLEAVKDDNRDYLALMKEFLSSTYIKDNLDIIADNIDPDKIEKVMNDAWDKAGDRMDHKIKSSDLMGSYRTHVFKQIRKMVAVLCNYVSLIENHAINDNDSGLIAYKREKSNLVANITEAINYLEQNVVLTPEEYSGQRVLHYTLTGLLSRLNGTYNDGDSKYFYLGFLQNDKVLLDEDYFPVLDDVTEIDKLSILNRIEEHSNELAISLEERLVAILGGQDDYGSARLILHYFQNHAEQLNNKDLLNVNIEKAVVYPKKDMETKRKEFIEDLELAQSYGQIDNTTEDRKETLIQVMDVWYAWAMETENFGFFYKILEAIREKIKKDAQIRAVDLERHLSSYQTEYPDWEHDEQTRSAIQKIAAGIEMQNYAASEDMLNRLIAGDVHHDTDFIQDDYLAQFLEEYTTNAMRAGKANSTLQASLKGHNKDSKGASRLIENWPKQKGTPASKIKNLLTSLGFSVDTVTPQPVIQGKDHFHVLLKKPANGRKANYKHPIPAFGSDAEEKGFRVVCIFGKMDADRLIDTFKEIGTAKNTLILLDYSLTLPDRRELARRTKTEFNAKTFAVIDRVVLVYLASHYSETAVNRMLMAVIMPFAAYQPYIADSSKVIPPEMFIGRKTELNKIEASSGVNIVYGGRQLGKSALLRMAQKDINRNENGDRAILIDIKGLDYKAAAKKISRDLYAEKILKVEHITEDWDELSYDIQNRLREENDKIPYLLLLMDEADVFIESCEEVNFHPFDALKEIQCVGSDRFKFVIAGLRNIVRFKKNIALSNNHVLTQLSSLTIMPFQSTEARELLQVPLSYLGFRFPEDTKTEMLISTIFGTTNYFPGLLQLYCSKLIEAVERDYAGYDENETPPYVVKEAHIKKVLADKTLEEQIREKFFITLKVDEDDYYYLIALLIAFHYHNNKEQNGCSPDDIMDIAASYEITKISSLSNDKILALMEEMRELNVLQQVRNGNYRFARHSFCQMMGSMSQIEDEIMEYAIAQEE